MAAEAIGLTASLIAISEVCVKSIGYYRTAKDATRERARLAAEIQFCRTLIGELQDVSTDDDWTAMIEVLVGPGAPLKLLEETLHSLKEKLAPGEGFRHGIDVLKWPFQEKEIKRILDMIERQKASLSLALDNDSRRLQEKIASEVKDNTESLKELKKLFGSLRQEIDDVRRSIQQRENCKALRWITKLNFGPRHERLLQSWNRETGTGTWILNHPKFYKWMTSPSSTIWCHGKPGAGKSVISAIVFDYLNGSTLRQLFPNMSVAIIYCDYQLQADQTLDELERSIFHQALASFSRVPDEISKLHKSTREGYSPPRDKLHSAVRSTFESSGTLFIVLDALDEAVETVQDQILDRIMNLPFKDIRLLCTSRHLPKFEDMFATADDIHIVASDEDISKFVRKQMTLVSRLGTIVKGDTELENHIVSRVRSTAQGSFLMASQHMNDLSQAGSKGDIRRTLDRLPAKAKDAYDLTIKRIRAQPELDRIRAERTLSLFFGPVFLGSLGYNRTQPDLSEVQHALATLSVYEDGESEDIAGVELDDVPHPDLIIQCCQGLLVLEKDLCLRPSHNTITDYFREAYLTCLPDGLRVLSEACCYYLSQRKLHNVITDFSLAVSRGRNWNRWERSEEFDKFPFLTFASQYAAIYTWEAYRAQSSHILAQRHRGMMRWWTGIQFPNRRPGFIMELRKVQSALRVSHRLGHDTESNDSINVIAWRLIHQAVKANDKMSISFLVELSGLKLDPSVSELTLLLDSAIRRGMEALIRHLLSDERGAMALKVSTGAMRQLQMVALDCCTNSREAPYILEFLIEAEQDLASRSSRHLFLDILRGCQKMEEANYEVLGILLEANLEIRAVGADGNSVFACVFLKAAEKGIHSLVELLCQHELGKSLLSSVEVSAAQIAVDHGEFSFFLLLLPKMSCHGRELLRLQVQKRGKKARYQAAALLLSAPSIKHSGTKTDSQGRTALSWLASDKTFEKFDNLEVIFELLLGHEFGSEINQQDKFRRHALSYAAMNSQINELEYLVRWLIEKGADVTLRDVDGMTPFLYMAANKRHYENVLTFIQADYDIDEYEGIQQIVDSSLLSGSNVPEPTQKLISARIDLFSIVLDLIVGLEMEDIGGILLGLWAFLGKADLDYQGENRQTLRFILEHAELPDIGLMSKVLYFSRYSADELDLNDPNQWQAVIQQHAEAQMGIPEVRGKKMRRSLSQCLKSKMRELRDRQGEVVREAAQQSM